MPNEDDDKNKDDKTGGDSAKELADLKASNATLMARLEKLEGSSNKDKDQDPDLLEKARKARETDGKKQADTKSLEAALKFNLNSSQFLKDHATLLPKDIADIFKSAEAEKFDTAIEKDAAIKAGIIQSFFSIQANLDLLTPGLKSSLEDYLKLTKTGKQDKAQQIYDSIFEPAFEMLKRVKKAEALQKGHGTGSDDAYKQKLMAGSKKHYLGEKQT